MPDFSEALARAQSNSPFLSHLIDRQPELAALLGAGDLDAALAWGRARGNEEGVPISAQLRRERNALALTTAIADLSGAWDLRSVTVCLSDFADDALDRAITAAFAERYDCPPVSFAVIALGKHGGRELNYSSDIDPIFLFDPDSMPTRGREEPAEAAVRIGRKVIETLSARDGEGYVFRVDMRLRPSPEVTPIVLPVEAAISYYESSALAWEQAAFIRARVAAGDRSVAAYFLRAIQPFVWRKSLDFGQVNNIAAMSNQIRDHYHEGQRFGPGYDLKRGRGGIRECEFFGQVHQLIHGGRDPALRVADTRDALRALADAGKIDAGEARVLSDSYAVLRTIEHRVQMLNDLQTHDLPVDDAGMDAVARLHGLTDGDALIALLAPIVEQVGAIYDGFTHGGEGGAQNHLPEGGPALTDHLTQMGFADTEQAARMIAHWRSGKVRAIRSSAAREAFEGVVPELLLSLARSPDPERALLRFDRFVERLPTAVNFFHLMKARPGLLETLATIMAQAPTLADQLGQRAELLDGLIDARALDLPPGVPTLERDLAAGAEDYERLLDRVRERVGEHRFALGVQMVEGVHDPLDITEGYARVAEGALGALTQATIAQYAEQHGVVEGSELVILALGRLGGGALTHASDLDLVFLYSGDNLTESTGPKPLGVAQYYNRLAQRVVAAMSVATASGPLYEIDTRLRPSGTQGMLCVSLDAFARYQHEQAWTWEHMALCRARPVYGGKEARAALSAIVTDVLSTPRDAEKLRNDVRDMRRDMAAHKPPKGPMDAKLLPGGLVDIEFLTHYLQLREHDALFPGVETAIRRLVELGHVDAGFAEAHLFMTRMLAIVRLVAPGCDEPPVAAQGLVARLMGQGDWAALLNAFDAARAHVVTVWERHLGARDFVEE